MPIPKWCDRKSIRTVKRGGAQILICCRKGKWKAGRCTVGTKAIDVRSANLIKGARIERREHPSFTAKQAKRIAGDHLARNPRAYGAAWLNDSRLPDHDQAGDRIHGDKRPKQHAPHHAMIVARKLVRAPGMAPVKLQVETNRTQTRFWFKVLIGEKPTPGDSLAHLRSHQPDAHGLIYPYMTDCDSTTSKKKADGWIAALNS